jgi:hypothetical protein
MVICSSVTKDKVYANDILADRWVYLDRTILACVGGVEADEALWWNVR